MDYAEKWGIYIEKIFYEKRYNFLLTDANGSDKISLVAEVAQKHSKVLFEKKELSYVNKCLTEVGKSWYDVKTSSDFASDEISNK